MSKYIIKNCENLLYCTSCEEYECAIANDFGYKRKCSDNNNCKMKQIVELCKDAKTECECYDTHLLCIGEKIFAEKILNLLDIQEVE